jgi:hypothetical protein
VTKFRRGIADGAEGVEDLATVAISALDRAVSKGVLHRNSAARRKARLMKRLASGLTTAVAPTPAPAAKSAPKKTTRSKTASKR